MKKTISILIILCVVASLFAAIGSVRLGAAFGFAPSISMPVSLGAVYYF